MANLPSWKRALGVVGLLGISVWLTVMGLQTIRVECADGACVHSVRYAGITARETPFTPSPATVSWRRTGKYNNQGVVDIRSSGDKVSISWLSPAEAEAATTGILHDRRYTIESTGPRWWLLFLFATIPFMVSFIVVPRLRLPRAKALPVEQTKKAARAARRRHKKAAERGTS